MAAWRHILCSNDGVEIDEIRGSQERSAGLALNGVSSGGLRVSLRDPLAGRLMDDDVIMKSYRAGTVPPLLCGPVLTAEEVTGGVLGPTVAVTYADPFIDLIGDEGRLCGKLLDAEGRGAGLKLGTPLAPMDRTTMISQLLDAANAEGNTRIRMGNTAPSSASHAGPWYFKPVGEAIAEISSALDGPDFRVRAVEPFTDVSGLVLGLLDVTPAFGQVRPDVIFAYETGERNCSGYQRARRKQTTNRVFHLPPGFPDAPTGPVVTALDQAAINARGLHEAVVPGDIGALNLRQRLCDEHVRVRKTPRTITTFTVKVDAGPQFGSEWGLGDLVTAQATFEGVPRMDETLRVYGVDFAPGDDGRETVQPRLVPA
ncbi:MAG: hypothetical protein WKF96_00090 [Solirubrobacteraceae bacterium]